MDTFTPEERSALMSKIRGKNTKPEIRVRSMLHRAGYRFSLHRKNLPGKPDIVLRKYKTVIFVHGCFWHRHEGCKTATTPKSNIEFWQEKFDRNVANDKKHRQKLEQLGWNVVVVWECELKHPDQVLARLERELHKQLKQPPATHADLSHRNKAVGDQIIPYPTAEKEELPIAAETQEVYRTSKGK